MKTKNLLFLLFFLISGIISVANAQVNISTATVANLDTCYLHTGYAVAPTPTLSNDSTLTNGISYTISYANNTDLGTATLTISGIGNYTGTVVKNFKIMDATRSLGYNLWDSNGSVTATLDTLDLSQTSQIIHAQIKFDNAIQIVDPTNLRSQFTILVCGSYPESSSTRTVAFAVNSTNSAILDITIAPTEGLSTAQTNNAISFKATNVAGWIPAITDKSGNPVNLISFSTVQPTGLAFTKVASTTGTNTQPASVTYKFASIPLVRAMNFYQARSNKCSNTDGYIGAQYFTVHSHAFYSFTSNYYITTLVSTANVATFNNAGYTFEKIASNDATNPYFKLTANTATEGEELSWVVYHYPYRSAADQKFELSQIMDTITTATTSQLEAAQTVLYDINATAQDVTSTINTLNASSSSGIASNTSSSLKVSASGNTIYIKGATLGDKINIINLTGQTIQTKNVYSDVESVYVKASGLYIVKVGKNTQKILID